MRKTNSLPTCAYIFDNDGTLSDTETIWFEACKVFAARYGGVFTVDLQRQMMGHSAHESVRIMQRAFAELPQGEQVLPRLIEERTKCFRDVRASMGVQPMPGVHAMIGKAKRRGIPIALATSAFREDANVCLKALGLRYAFDAIVTGDDVTHHKPHPEIYLTAAQWLGVPPECCTAFEDSEMGIESARAAGMAAVFVWDQRFHTAPPARATLVLRSFREFLG